MSGAGHNSSGGKKRMSLKKRIAAALAACGFEVSKAMQPFRYQSHCAGMDAPAFALHNLGVRTECELASENNPSAALFHMMHHPSTQHLVADMKYIAKKTSGPCVTHGGRMCTWNDAAGQLDCVASSFVCKPWSQSNPKRFKQDPVRAEHMDEGVDTYHHTRAIIKKFLPKTFALENVDGVIAVRTPEGITSTPMDYMLNDEDHGLRTIKGTLNGVEVTYSVEVVSHIKGTDYGVPQDRPRTLVFGVRSDLRHTAKDVVGHFRNIAQAYKEAGGMSYIDDYVTVRTTGPVAVDDAPASDAEADLGTHIQYCQEFQKAVDGLRKKTPSLKATLLPEDSRPSRNVPHATSRTKAIIDAHYLVQQQHVDGCSRADCRCHAVADVSKSIDRVPSKNDGTVPTLTTGSLVYSYKLGAFLDPQDLANSMGYKSINMAPFSSSAAARMAGNGYLVPVCTCALTAVCIATGHVIKK